MRLSVGCASFTSIDASVALMNAPFWSTDASVGRMGASFTSTDASVGRMRASSRVMGTPFDGREAALRRSETGLGATPTPIATKSAREAGGVRSLIRAAPIQPESGGHPKRVVLRPNAPPAQSTG